MDLGCLASTWLSNHFPYLLLYSLVLVYLDWVQTRTIRQLLKYYNSRGLNKGTIYKFVRIKPQPKSVTTLITKGIVK